MIKKSTLMVLIFLILTTTAHAVDKNRYISEPDAVFCMSLSAITNLMIYMDQKDKNATAKLFKNGDCAIVKSSINVFIVQEKGSNLVRIRREGMTDTLWTFRGALKK